MEFVFREWDTEFRELLREYPGNIRELDYMSCSEKSPKNPATPFWMDVCLRFRGKCCPFLSEIFSGDLPPNFCDLSEFCMS